MDRTKLFELRKLVRCVLRENETLKKWNLKDEEDEIGHALAKLGIYVLHSGEEDKILLGQGAFNKVYDVTYKNKHAVARISSSQDEVDALKMFESYKDVVPKKYAKHFPKVYLYFEISVGSRKNVTLFGAVVEKLQELPPGLKHDLKSQFTINPHRLAVLDRPTVISMAKQSSSDPKIQRRMVAFYFDEILPRVEKLSGKHIDYLDTVIDEILPATAEYRKFYNLLYLSQANEVIGINADEHERRNILAKKNPSKSVRQFNEFLNVLTEAGLEWDDMHSGNFMMRKNGDIVIVDPGAFYG